MCPSTTVQSELTKFYGACMAELTSSPNTQVQLQYDVLYSIIPMQNAICTKDDTGKYCVTEIGSNSTAPSSSTLSTVAQYLWTTVSNSVSVALAIGRRDTSVSNSTLITPNATTFAQNNILYLFLQPSLSSASLCQTCTRNILTSYITFESNVPYAAGLTNSPLLSTQTALYEGVQSVCGASFLSGAVEAAGNLSGGIMGSSSGALRMLSNSIGAVGVAMGTLLLGAMWVL